MIANSELCCGCEGCKNICPVNAIKMKENSEGFWHPAVNENICTHCGLCKKVCPVIGNKISEGHIKNVYAAQTKDEKICKESSSGGMAYAIAKHVINNGGVVYGAAFNEEYGVSHIRVDSLKDLHKIMGSKYLQSSIDIVYKKFEQDLKNGIYICFFGTSCQIQALQKFAVIKKLNDNNVLFVDIICHGVPSPMVWQEYIKKIKQKYNDEVINIKFRNKRISWKYYDLLIEFKNNAFSEYHKDNVYLNLFFRNYILRESCYNCRFTEKNRTSDITLGDFWGIEAIHKFKYKRDMDKGVSLVIVNSQKGQDIINKVSSECWLDEADIDMCYQKNLRQPTAKPKQRDNFWNEYISAADKSEVICKYGRSSKVWCRFKDIMVYITIKLGIYRFLAFGMPQSR